MPTLLFSFEEKKRKLVEDYVDHYVAGSPLAAPVLAPVAKRVSAWRQDPLWLSEHNANMLTMVMMRREKSRIKPSRS